MTADRTPTANSRSIEPMTVSALSVSSQSPFSIEADVLLVGVQSIDGAPRLVSDFPELSSLAEQLPGMGVTGGADELTRLPGIGSARSVALIGLGNGDVSPQSLRYAAGSAARQLVGIESLSIALPTTTTDDVLAVLEGAAIGAYAFTLYRHSSLEKTKVPASAITVRSDVAVTDDLVQRAATVAE